MGVDAVDLDAVRVHVGRDEAVERALGRGGGALALVVAEHEDADVAGVVVLDVCALERLGAACPDTACGVNGVVVADVGPALVDVAGADVFEAAGGVVVGRACEGRHPVVVDGEAADVTHAVGAAEHGPVRRPGRPAQDRDLARKGLTRDAVVRPANRDTARRRIRDWAVVGRRWDRIAELPAAGRGGAAPSQQRCGSGAEGEAENGAAVEGRARCDTGVLLIHSARMLGGVLIHLHHIGSGPRCGAILQGVRL